MTAAAQKRLAIAGAVVALAVFIAANAQFIAAAFRAQPACVVVPGAPMPAKHAC